MFFRSILYKATEEKVKTLMYKWVGKEIGGISGRIIEIFYNRFSLVFSHITVLLIKACMETYPFARKHFDSTSLKSFRE